MNIDRTKELSSALYSANLIKQQIACPAGRYPDLTIEDAYKIQSEMVNSYVNAGYHHAGKKVGFTIQSKWDQVGISEPDYGYMFHELAYTSGDILTVDKFTQPMLETEIAFVLKDDLAGPEITYEQVVKATDHVVAAFEIVDFRTSDSGRTAIDIIADNAAFGAYVVGSKKIDIHSVDLYSERALIYKNDQLTQTGSFSDVMNGPVNSIIWAANKFNRLGHPLKAGEIILSGSAVSPISIAPNDAFRAEFSTLGNISIKFI